MESELEVGREMISEEGYQSKKGFFSHNITGNFTFVDENFANIFGYTKEELLSMNFVEIIHIDDLDKSLKIYSNFLKTGQIQESIIVKCVRKNKTVVTIEVNEEVFKNGDEALGVKGYVKVINTEEINGISSMLSETQIKEVTKKINKLDKRQKRTFTTIRNIILICLSKGQLSINELSNLSGINWKTVENHLTYLMGKNLVKENFSSKYVRLFELTKKGKEYALKLQKDISELFIQKTDNIEVTKL